MRRIRNLASMSYSRDVEIEVNVAFDTRNKKRSPVRWAEMGLVSLYLVRHWKMLQPSVLILSLPRSGSSWVGEILGSSSDALYLREPLTQSAMAIDDSQPTEMYIDPLNAPQFYKHFADTAFAGLPMFPRFIVRYPEQWILSKRRQRRLVVKEVNLLACDWLVQCYRPRIILLLRHPAAVALSYFKIGWININIQKMFFSHERLINGPLKKWQDCLKPRVSGFWAKHGVLQGAVLRFAADSLNRYPEHKIILYEDLCSRPMDIFQELFAFANLRWNERIEKFIRDKSKNGDRGQFYTTTRNSKKMIDVWKGKIPEDNLHDLKETYGAFDLPWYRSSSDWQ